VCHHSQVPPLETAGTVRYNSRSREGNSTAQFTAAYLLNPEISPRKNIEIYFFF
jgi:hypothetical protein